MPVTPTYPGVYIEEIPSGVHTITGVATSVAAFIDFFGRGPLNEAVQVLSMADFEREFGGLNALSEASYGVQQFFLNGGAEAWIVRVASGAPARATAVIRSGTGGGAATALTVRAASEGGWGNSLRARVDAVDATTFNLTVTEVATVNGRTAPVRSETFRGLVMSSASTRFVERVVNEGSTLVNVTASGNNPPLQTGTVSDTLPADITFSGAGPNLSVDVTIGSAPAVTATFPKPTGATSLARVAALIEGAIRAAKPDDPAFAGTTVQLSGTDRLRVLAGPTPSPAALVTFAATGGATPDATTVDDLKLAPKATPAIVPIVNVQEYALGVTSAVTNTAQAAGAAGNDGTPPNGTALIGDQATKTGIFALEDVDLFNLLCIPRTALDNGPAVGELSTTEAAAVKAVAEAYCAERRAFFLMDTPNDVDTPVEVRAFLAANDTLRDRNGALYFPRVRIPDPLDEFRLRSVGASGTIAGLFARIDSARGVWKAPAGTEATLRNVAELEYTLTDAENGTLNPLGINCLRTFPIFGTVCWGARTLEGADQLASEWKYVPVRRVALYIEESLFRGTKWAVFEPNDEPLWAQIRLNVGAFMHNLFRQGAFQGRTSREAYFVKCDGETTTQNDIDLGVVNVVVGFAPLKPAEFVIIKIQQIAGQIQT